MSLPSEIYDREYFLSETCEGYTHFVQGGLSPLKARVVGRLGVGPGMSVLDAGCGRGEMLLECARRGASVAGIDYSEASVELTRATLEHVPDADVRLGDVTDLPWPDGSFDRALFADVIEHLDPNQAGAALRELQRVLRPGGELFVHTAPNRLFLAIGWPVARPVLRAARKHDTVHGLEYWINGSKRYHVNEQSVFSLRRGLRRAGFEDVRAWVDPNVLRHGHEHPLTRDLERSQALRLAGRVAGSRPLRAVLGNDLYAVGRRPASARYC